MKQRETREVWLRGMVPDVPALLQPVAHCLLQAREEANALLENFDEKYLWQMPAGAASVAFHLQHLSGVLDRLFTYANAKTLSSEQLKTLAEEGKFDAEINIKNLISRFNEQVDKSIDEIKIIDEQTLKEPRSVGRAQLPSTKIGLLFHAAEHTMRHVGQLLVTVKVLNAIH